MANLVSTKRNRNTSMHKVAEYTVDDVFTAINTRTNILPDGRKVKLNSARIKLFYNKGVECVQCGIAGSVFALETHDLKVKPHMNLYAVNDNGCEVLMTKDHIHPRALGGPDSMENYQTMCLPCNNKKADKI